MKKARCFADGGAIGADGLTDAQRARLSGARSNLGVSNAPPPPAPVQESVQAPAPAPQQHQGIASGIVGILKGRQAQIDKAAGYANGGKIIGPGTPTSDSIDAQVSDTGEPIKVSTKERIVSHEQDQLLQRLAKAMGFASVDAFFEAGTGKPVGPTIKGGKRGLSGGGSIYDPTYEALKKIPDQAFPNTMNAIRSSGDAAKAAADAGNYGGAIGQVGRGAIGGIVGLGNDVVNSAAYALDPAANALKTFVTGDSSPARSAVQSSVTGSQSPQSATAGPPVSVPSITDLAAKSSDPQFMTGAKQGDMPTSAQGGFTQGGKSYNVKPIDSTEQQGITRVTAPGTSPLYTNIAPEQAVAGLKNQTIGGDAASVQEGLDRYAKANEIRKSMIDSQPQGGIAILGDETAQDRENAEKTARWRRDDLVSLASRGNQGAVIAAINADQQASQEPGRREIALRGQDANYSATIAGHGITARGQDLAAQRAAGHDSVLMRGQDITGKNDSERNRILGEQAKAKQPSYKDSFITVGGGQEWDERAGTMRNVPQRLVDLRTLQDVGGQQQQAAVPTPDKREVGKTYNTPKGPMIWRGNGWESA